MHRKEMKGSRNKEMKRRKSNIRRYKAQETRRDIVKAGELACI